MGSQQRHGYDEVADEYYDAARHPTCANFREASELILQQWARWLSPPPPGLICELGAGRSLVAEMMTSDDRKRLVITDASLRMLQHSDVSRSTGAKYLITDAQHVATQDGAFKVVVSILGDPYNDALTWREARRILAPRGQLLFTTPSKEWAIDYRDRTGSEPVSAVFETERGLKVSTPSNVLSEADQMAMFTDNGFDVEEVVRVVASELRRTRLSPKLADANRSGHPIVTGYRLSKSHGSQHDHPA